MYFVVKFLASPRFWKAYNTLPSQVQKLADDSFALLKANPQHPSLHLKQVGRFWSARVGIHYRVLGVLRGEDLVWFWIGPHGGYDRLVKLQ